MGVKTLYIGDVNRIWQALKNPDGSPVTGETVTFTVRTAKSYTAAVLTGTTANTPMPYDATKKRYEALWNQDEALNLVEGTNYYLHIQSVSHGRRLITCTAKYNEGG